MKKILLIFPLSAVLLFCGCGSENELGNNDIITVFYADFNNEIYEITAETTNFKEKGNPEKTLQTAYGKNLTDAYLQLLDKMFLTPYLGHTTSLIIGDGLCRSKMMKETLLFFADINIISPDISVFLTEDSISDFEAGKIYDAVKNETLPHSSLYTFFLPKSVTSIIPVISSVEGLPQGTGGAVTENMEFKYYLTEEEYSLFRILKNDFNEKYYKSCEIISSKGSTKVKGETLEINLKAEIKNMTDKNQFEKDIYNLSKKAEDNNFKELFSEKHWDNAEIKADITTAYTGKIKDWGVKK